MTNANCVPPRRLSVLAAIVFAAAAAQSNAADPYAPPASYYASATGTGATLKSQLSAAMAAGHIQRSYGDFRYSAAIHDADPNAAGRILSAYDRRSYSSTWDSGATWNREHVWPQSRQPGSASNSTRGALADPHGLRPLTSSVNSSRGNKPFGFASTTGSYGSQGTYYFPGDTDRGDIARALFYMDTRWGPSNGLSLVETTPSGYQMGQLSALVAWHFLDPPDEFERRRNHAISSNSLNPSYYTNNRSAYIDRPEAVWTIYVDQQNDSSLFVGAGPASDGSSQLTLSAQTLVGGPQPAPFTFTLNRSGFDGVYYDVATTGPITSTADGRHNAFPINTSGAAARLITVSVNGVSTSNPGVTNGAITIDNLDLTTGAGAGKGANDNDDIVSVSIQVLDHATASLHASSTLNAIVLDFGSIPAGSGLAQASVDVHNLESAPGATAALDLELGASSGDVSTITTAFTQADAIPAGDSHAVSFQLHDDTPGDFDATYTLRAFDARTLTGALEGTPLTIHVFGAVAPTPLCDGDVDGDGATDVFDFADLATHFGDGPGATRAMGDLTGDGFVDVFDFSLLASDFGCRTE